MFVIYLKSSRSRTRVTSTTEGEDEETSKPYTTS